MNTAQYPSKSHQSGGILPLLLIVLLLGGLFVVTRLVSVQQIFKSKASTTSVITFVQQTKSNPYPIPLPTDPGSGLPITTKANLIVALNIPQDGAISSLGVRTAAAADSQCPSGTSPQCIGYALSTGTNATCYDQNKRPVTDVCLNSCGSCDSSGELSLSGGGKTNTPAPTNSGGSYPLLVTISDQKSVIDAETPKGFSSISDYDSWAVRLPLNTAHTQWTSFQLTDPHPGTKTVYAKFTYPNGYQLTKQSYVIYQPDYTDKDCKSGVFTSMVGGHGDCKDTYFKYAEVICYNGTVERVVGDCRSYDELNAKAQGLCQGQDKSLCNFKPEPSCQAVSTFALKTPCGAGYTCADGYQGSIGGNTFTVGPQGGTFNSKCDSVENMLKVAQQTCSAHQVCKAAN